MDKSTTFSITLSNLKAVIPPEGATLLDILNHFRGRIGIHQQSFIVLVKSNTTYDKARRLVKIKPPPPISLPLFPALPTELKLLVIKELFTLPGMVFALHRGLGDPSCACRRSSCKVLTDRLR